MCAIVPEQLILCLRDPSGLTAEIVGQSVVRTCTTDTESETGRNMILLMW